MLTSECSPVNDQTQMSLCFRGDKLGFIRTTCQLKKKNGTNTKLLVNKNARHTLYTLCNQSHLSEIYAQNQKRTEYLIAMKAGELITSRHGDAVLIGEGYDNDLHLDLSGTDGCVYLLSPNVRHISVTKATQDGKKKFNMRGKSHP